MTQNAPEGRDINELLFPPAEDDEREEFYMTRSEADAFTKALKDEEFRKLFVEYVEEVQDPENQAQYQREMKQLELERGNVVHFVNPVPGYVLKTSINGEKKGFINICSNPIIRRATFQNVIQNNEKGSLWSIPYAQSPPREDVDKSGSYCIVYDVIFHPDTLTTARKDKQLRDQLENTAINSVISSFSVDLDKANVKRPKLRYKGLAKATAIKYKVGDALPPVIDPAAVKNELPPQGRQRGPTSTEVKTSGASRKVSSPIPVKKPVGRPAQQKEPRTSVSDGNEGDDDESWTEPRYSIKYRSHMDMQDFTTDTRKVTKTQPDELILTVDLPLLRDSLTLDADVVDGGFYFELKSEIRARYKLKLKLPYQVAEDSAKAQFDKDKRKLVVTLKTVQKKAVLAGEGWYLKGGGDGGVAKNGDSFDTDEDVGTSGGSEEGARSLPNMEKPIQVISSWTNNQSIKGILKRSGRIRSLSESCVDKMAILRTGKDDSISLESLNEEVESDEPLSTSPNHEKSVRFSDSVQRQLYRSNSSIIGQKKKNQRRAKNKRKARERANSEGSASSFEVDADDEDHGYTSSSSILCGTSVASSSHTLQPSSLKKQ